MEEVNIKRTIGELKTLKFIIENRIEVLEDALYMNENGAKSPIVNLGIDEFEFFNKLISRSESFLEKNDSLNQDHVIQLEIPGLEI